MKHSAVTKLFLILVCALSLTALVLSGGGILVGAYAGIYDSGASGYSPPAAFSTSQYASYLAESFAQRYAAETLGGCPEEVLDAIYDDELHIFDGNVTLSMNGETLASNGLSIENPYVYTDEFSVFYPSAKEQVNRAGDPIEPEGTMGYIIDEEDQTFLMYKSPVYTLRVEIELTAYQETEDALFSMLFQYRYVLIGIAAASLAVFGVFLTMLCVTAGHAPGSGELRPGGLNRVPLDLYGLCSLTGLVVLVLIAGEFGRNIFSFSLYLTIPVVCGLVFLGALLVVGFLFAFAAQVKLPGKFWWHHSVTGWCLDWVGKALRFLFRGARATLRMMPVIWQWLLILFSLVVSGFMFLIFAINCHSNFFVLFWLAMAGLCALTFIGVICYAGYAFGVLMQGVRAMAQGQLYYQIPTTNLIGSFRDFAMQLNTMGGAMQVAVSRQMKSERMKTELITNVSHDIKTPLTSIINYVDLLKMPHSPEAGEQYLEVLDRQSQRLKKLIDDLMELSKANSGTLAVNYAKINAAEAVNQALGEFADKLDSVGLQPVFHHPQEPVMIHADGRLLWRVLSNILSNAVKYALPNTRLYLDLTVLQGNAVITVKNISREQLNVAADELMERFVRGDLSRNTEGSGLGLNIAKTLTELQKGQMHLMVDGDLFKVTLMFPTI